MNKVFNFVADHFLYAFLFAAAFALLGHNSPKVYQAYVVGENVYAGMPAVAGAWTCDVVGR